MAYPYPLPCNFEQKRELERLIIRALNRLEGDLKGNYYGLNGSQSANGGMDKEIEKNLRSNSYLFQEPYSTSLLSSGCFRHWPDARGIFHNDAKTFFVWGNEENHLRIISMEQGDNIKSILKHFVEATTTIERILNEEGRAFMHSNHLGFISTCPSSLPTGFRASAMAKVPLFSARQDFKKVLSKMGLQARGTAGEESNSVGGTFDISNYERLGKSELDLCNTFIEGIAQVINSEQALGEGRHIDEEVRAKLGNNR